MITEIRSAKKAEKQATKLYKKYFNLCLRKLDKEIRKAIKFGNYTADITVDFCVPSSISYDLRKKLAEDIREYLRKKEYYVKKREALEFYNTVRVFWGSESKRQKEMDERLEQLNKEVEAATNKQKTQENNENKEETKDNDLLNLGGLYQ